MAGKLSAWQVVGPKRWKGLQTSNSLAAMALKNQQLATDSFVRLLAWKYGNTLDTLLSKFTTKTFDTSDDYTWKLMGPSRRNIPLVEARDTNGTTIDITNTNMIGANQAPFYLVFNEDWSTKAV